MILYCIFRFPKLISTHITNTHIVKPLKEGICLLLSCIALYSPSRSCFFFDFINILIKKANAKSVKITKIVPIAILI